MPIENTALATIDQPQDLIISRPPEAVLEEAKQAAKALKDVVSKKAKPVLFNGEQYLEFEDLQTLGRFYGVTAKIITSRFIEYGDAKGFEATAVAVRTDGTEISAAEAMCLNDEPNWRSKPLFQLRSMAQTRACAKALRNVLAWVVVLAGYKATPAEEMIEGTARIVEDLPICPIHRVPFKKITKEGQTWYSHKCEDGTWCNKDKVDKPEKAAEPQANGNSAQLGRIRNLATKLKYGPVKFRELLGSMAMPEDIHQLDADQLDAVEQELTERAEMA